MHLFLFYFSYERNPKGWAHWAAKVRVFVTRQSRRVSLLRGKRKVPTLYDRSHLVKGGCHHNSVTCLWENSMKSLGGRGDTSPRSAEPMGPPPLSLSSRTRGMGQAPPGRIEMGWLWHGATWQRLRTASPACGARYTPRGQVCPHRSAQPGGMPVSPACTRS